MLRAFRLKLPQLGDVSRDVLLFCLGFALLRAWAVIGRPPVRYNDSPTYFDISFIGHAPRLWTVPLFFSPLPSDQARVLMQVVVAIACWSALAFAVARSLRNPVVARIGAILVLLLGLCGQVTEWDQVILSESLALSLTALLVAALLWLRLQRSKGALVAMLVVLVLWVFTRQLQAIIYVLVSLPVIAWILLRARRYVLIACALAVIAVWGGYATSQAKTIIAWNAHNLLTSRLLEAPGGADFFASHGMPDMAALKRDTAHPEIHGEASAVYRDPKWRAWIDHNWKQTYAEWLLRHPVDDFRLPLLEAPVLLSAFPNYASARPVLPPTVQDDVWGRSPGDLPLWFALTFVAWLIALRAGRPSSLDAFGVTVVAVSILWYLTAWHLAVSENQRIMLPSAAALRIGLFILLFAAVDRIALHQSELRHQHADVQ